MPSQYRWSDRRRGQPPNEDPRIQNGTRDLSAYLPAKVRGARLALAPQNVARALATLSPRARRSGRASACSVCSVARVIQPFDLQIAISRARPSAGPPVSHAAASLDPWILRVSRAERSNLGSLETLLRATQVARHLAGRVLSNEDSALPTTSDSSFPRDLRALLRWSCDRVL